MLTFLDVDLSHRFFQHHQLDLYNKKKNSRYSFFSFIAVHGAQVYLGVLHRKSFNCYVYDINSLLLTSTQNQRVHSDGINAKEISGNRISTQN